MTLQQLSEKYGTDKSTHGYCPFYEQHLPKNPKKLLEIGVLKGDSIRMWKEWFPDCEIHGLDLFEANPVPDIEGVIWHKGNQCDYLLLDRLRNENFDVIIDDGSHNSRDQMITFFGLFNGNQYYIEDTHCCKQPFYNQGLPFDMTALGLFNQLRFPHGWNRIIQGENIILIK